MRMSAQLQIHTVLLGFFQLEWLMVKHDDVIATGNALHQLFDALAATVAAVITTDNGHVTDRNG